MSDTVITRPSVCTLDCPDTCSLTVEIRDNTVQRVRGSRANPFTGGAVCAKVANCFPDYVHGANRLRHPLVRTGVRGGDGFERVSWDTAIDAIHAGFTRAIERHGPESVMPLNYAGPHGELAGGSMDRRFFHRLGATLLHRGSLCGAVRSTAYRSLYGKAPGMPPEEALHADLILVWGNNVTVSNLHFTRLLQAVRKQGGRVVVIDPRRTRIARQADLHLAVRPGTDVVLALAIANALEQRGALDHDFIDRWTLGFEAYMRAARRHGTAEVQAICGIEKDAFAQVLDWIVAATTMATLLGNGIERGRNGGSGLRAAMALQALTGQHGRRGAGVLCQSGLAIPFTHERLQGTDLIPEGTRCFDILDVPDKLLDPALAPPVDAIMIYNHNPVVTHPNQSRMLEALSRRDLFIAGSDVVMTDSMRHCDVILPATSQFEMADIYGAYGHNRVQRADAVIPPVGEALPNTEIFRRLAARFGFDDARFRTSDAELIDEALDHSHPGLEGLRPSELPLDRALPMTAHTGEPLVMCDNLAPQTPSGLIELHSEDLETRFGYGVPRFEAVTHNDPLNLITPSSDKRSNSTFGSHASSSHEQPLEMHPDDAASRGLADGQRVVAANKRGEVSFRLVISEDVLPGVIYSPKGAWRSTSSTTLTSNALIPSDIRADIEGGACYNETFVEVRPA